ncbi:uncharacterized protein A4U43_UnF11280 [Asparagus officinalis]|uniref:Uncharacterized protein n=1 Tax=Asparagus officinalis TaxID=4686 RepID=A0A1R3L5A3_ASPOF|nr:uncharacterized protein A4U43_UnF11280 [Asparagus officinalis]
MIFRLAGRCSADPRANPGRVTEGQKGRDKRKKAAAAASAPPPPETAPDTSRDAQRGSSTKTTESEKNSTLTRKVFEDRPLRARNTTSFIHPAKKSGGIRSARLAVPCDSGGSSRPRSSRRRGTASSTWRRRVGRRRLRNR